MYRPVCEPFSALALMGSHVVVLICQATSHERPFLARQLQRRGVNAFCHLFWLGKTWYEFYLLNGCACVGIWSVILPDVSTFQQIRIILLAWAIRTA